MNRELLNKLMMPKINSEIAGDTPDLPRTEIIIGMPMPEDGKEPEKEWSHRKDWICYSDECLLFISCVSDDGKAWFVKEFNNLLSFQEEDKMEMINKALQNAKSCNPEQHHYYLGECDTDDLKKNEELEKILPEDKIEGKNKFKDYEVPVNLEDFTKIIKKYCTYKYENPCGEY